MRGVEAHGPGVLHQQIMLCLIVAIVQRLLHRRERDSGSLLLQLSGHPQLLSRGVLLPQLRPRNEKIINFSPI